MNFLLLIFFFNRVLNVGSTYAQLWTMLSYAIEIVSTVKKESY
jgi:hypothetical protein